MHGNQYHEEGVVSPIQNDLLHLLPPSQDAALNELAANLQQRVSIVNLSWYNNKKEIEIWILQLDTCVAYNRFVNEWKESENSPEKWRDLQLNVHKHMETWDILANTDAFLDQKRVNVCEHRVMSVLPYFNFHFIILLQFFLMLLPVWVKVFSAKIINLP